MKTIVEALKDLYVAMGGDDSAVADFSLNPDVIEQIASLVQSGATKELPAVSSTDNGNVLTVVEGAWAKAAASGGLPAVTSEDNGDVLKVVEGVWAKAAGGSGETWEAKFTLHVSGQSFSESLSDIDAYNPASGDKVALMSGSTVVAHCTVLTFTRSGGALSSISFIDDILYPELIKKVITDVTDNSVYLTLVDPSNNTPLAPKAYSYSGGNVSQTRYQEVKLYTFTAQ